MSVLYYYSKFIKKVVRGKCLLNSKIHSTSKVYSGTSFVESSLGAYSYIGYDCDVYLTEIGKYCSIAKEVLIGAAEHPLYWVSTSPVFQDVKNSGPNMRFSRHTMPCPKRTIIGNDVWIGARAIIKQGVVIGDGAVIGSGSIVTKDVPPYAVVAGVPSQLIRYRFDDSTIRTLLRVKWWDMSEDKIKEVAKHIISPEVFIASISD